MIDKSTLENKGIILQVNDIKRFFDKENLRDVMNTLHKADINEGAYKAWLLMNHKTRISVETGASVTEEADMGEVVRQGTSGSSHKPAHH